MELFKSGCWRELSTKGLRVQSRRTTLQFSCRHRCCLSSLSLFLLPSSFIYTAFRAVTSGYQLCQIVSYTLEGSQNAVRAMLEELQGANMVLDNHEEASVVHKRACLVSTEVPGVTEACPKVFGRFHWLLKVFEG